MNVPNALTILRFLLIGVFVYLFKVGQPTAAVIVFIVAALTDLLDGYIARKYNQITNFGKLMDPLADKLMLIAALWCLVSADLVPMILLIFVLAKEALLIVGGAFLYKKKVVVYAKNFGKLATTCFNLGVVLTFFADYVYPAHVILFSVAIILAVCAFVQYAAGFYKENKRLAAEKTQKAQ